MSKIEHEKLRDQVAIGVLCALVTDKRCSLIPYTLASVAFEYAYAFMKVRSIGARGEKLMTNVETCPPETHFHNETGE